MSAFTQTLRRFAHHHDEMPAFHAGYLVITFLIAALFNLGVFAMLIAAHMSLDYVKYSEVHEFSFRKTLKGMFFESLIDIMLLSVALVFAVYLHYAAGLIALSGLLRAEQTILRAFGTLVPKLEILHHVYVDFVDVKHHMNSLPEEMMKGWTMVDKVCAFCAVAALLLVALAPYLLSLDQANFTQILQDQLIPWNL
ncbi:hypothetical protein HYZ99_05505 [Candidatus Peregrinibacteria bacterium]|nr:hypothetical protein [Candidatus Peregrinibacteria bacterium]